MQRRHFMQTTAALGLAGAGVSTSVLAHHGWSSFDLDRPVYLEGTADKVRWSNPHAELELVVSPGLKLPDGLAQRSVPAQVAQVDGKALLAKAVVPTRKDARWMIELAPLTRMEAWKVPEIKNGTPLGMLGFTFKDEKGQAILRVEYLWVGGQTYALRSSPV
jgi:hypothetical protein